MNWILDVSKVETMDSSGLGEILAALTILSDKGGTLAVAQPSSGFRRFIDSQELMGPCRVYLSITEAAAAISEGTASFLPNLD